MSVLFWFEIQMNLITFEAQSNPDAFQSTKISTKTKNILILKYNETIYQYLHEPLMWRSPAKSMSVCCIIKLF